MFEQNTVELDMQADSQIVIFHTMPIYITITRFQISWVMTMVE